jgi:hypothetical protein
MLRYPVNTAKLVAKVLLNHGMTESFLRYTWFGLWVLLWCIMVSDNERFREDPVYVADVRVGFQKLKAPARTTVALQKDLTQLQDRVPTGVPSGLAFLWAQGKRLYMTFRNPPIWQMVKQAIEHLDGEVGRHEIIDYIFYRFGPANAASISVYLTMLSVNVRSRVNFPQNQQPRLAVDPRYDVLYKAGHGSYTRYRQEIHGLWEIRYAGDGSLEVGQVGVESVPSMVPRTRTLRTHDDSEAYNRAVRYLSNILWEVEHDTGPYRDSLMARETVFAIYQPLFSPEHIPYLTSEEMASFLDFENNGHWRGLSRHKSRLIADMDGLRTALRFLLDENRAIEERLDTLRPRSGPSLVLGLGSALMTAILLVTNPDKYGVWNGTSEGAMRELQIWPEFERGMSFGEKYARVNHLLKRLTVSLKTDFWTLDLLWWSVKAADLVTSVEDGGQAIMDEDRAADDY